MPDFASLPFEQLKAIVDKVRAERFAARNTPVLPHQTATLHSSKDPQREIIVHIYDPPTLKEGKQPVVINWHGSGFILPSLGQNGPYCHWLAAKIGARIVDADYAKAPELPYPAAFQDAADVIKWTLAQPWCAPNIGLSGFSAGGTLLIAMLAPSMAKRYGLDDAEIEAIKAGVAFYPATGGTTAERLSGANVKDAAYLEQHGIPGTAFDAAALDLFFACLFYGVAPETQKDAIELSTKKQPASLWGKPQTIITCEYDSLEAEASEFASNLIAAGQDAKLLQTKGTSHGWESRVPVEEAEWTEKVKGGLAKKEAFELAASRLKDVLGL